MHLAAKEDHKDVIKLLYEHGADAVMNKQNAVSCAILYWLYLL